MLGPWLGLARHTRAMEYRLAGIRAKVSRGMEHLEVLHGEALAFISPETYELVSEFEPEQDCHVIRLRVLREIPLRFGILAGEAVQQFRSSLDHLAVQLARLNNPRTGTANFPIYTSRQVYTTPTGRKGHSPQDVCRRLFRPADLARIERMQPYNQPVPSNAGLAVLQRFSNLDKHSLIHTPFGRAERFHMAPQDADAKMEVLWGGLPHGAVDDGTEFARYRLWSNRPGDVQMEHTVRLSILFGDDGLSFVVLMDLAKGVIRIVDEFEAAVPELQPVP